MKIWVAPQAESAVPTDLADVEYTLFDGRDHPEPPGAEDVEVWVPPLIPVPDISELLSRMTRLRLIQTVTAGVEPYLPHVPDGVLLCNARGVHDAGTAEWAVGAMIAMQREFPLFVRAQEQGRWAYRHTGVLADSTVLILGYGSIGAALERRLAGFEVDVIRVARSARDGVHAESELPDLLPRADVVVLLVPATAGTKGMVDAAFLARMKDGALLVNAARGPVVDTGALLAELESGRLRAALDVTDPEPLPEGHALWKAPHLFITPHVAGSTPASTRRALVYVEAQLRRLHDGRPLTNIISGGY